MNKESFLAILLLIFESIIVLLAKQIENKDTTKVRLSMSNFCGVVKL